MTTIHLLDCGTLSRSFIIYMDIALLTLLKQSLIDCDSLPAEVHESNPNIPTFAKVQYITFMKVLIFFRLWRMYFESNPLNCYYASIELWT